jgi:hypothetical protein
MLHPMSRLTPWYSNKIGCMYHEDARQMSKAVTMINESNYSARSKSDYNTYNVFATKSGVICSGPGYICGDVKCKHVYAVEFYRRRNAMN